MVDSTKQVRGANFFLSSLLVSRNGGKSNSKAFSIRAGGGGGVDIIGQGESEKFDRFSPVYTALPIRGGIFRAFNARIVPLHPQGEEERKEEGRDLFPLLSFLSNLLDKYCSLAKLFVL